MGAVSYSGDNSSCDRARQAFIKKLTNVVKLRIKQKDKDFAADWNTVKKIEKVFQESERANDLRLEPYSRSKARFYSYREKKKSSEWGWLDLLYMLDLLELEFSKPLYDRLLEIFYAIKEERGL